MKYRKTYGMTNMVGINISKIRKAKGISQKSFIILLRESGLNINSSSYSKLEGQTRMATDKELYVIAKILNIKIDDLFDIQ